MADQDNQGAENNTTLDQPAFTAETIAAAVQAGLQAHHAQTESAPKEMTPEERAEYLQVFDPNQDGFVDNFVSVITDPEAKPEDRVKAISHLRDGIANQSIRGSEILMQREIAKLREEFMPAIQEADVRNAEKIWNKFAVAYPDLKDQRDLVDAVSVQLQQQGFKPTDLSEAFSRAATTARAIVAKATGQPAVTATPTAPNTMPRMTSTNTAGSGGGTKPQEQGNSTLAPFFLQRRR